MFIDEFIDSNINTKPPTYNPISRSVPPTNTSGLKAATSIKMLVGIKQKMKSVEIVTTILATLWFRVKAALTELTDDLCQREFL